MDDVITTINNTVYEPIERVGKTKEEIEELNKQEQKLYKEKYGDK